MTAVGKRFFAGLLASVLLSGCVTERSVPAEAITPSHGAAPVILISIDGFGPGYLDRGVTPNLNALADAGVRAEGMRPSFPANTFPNHYTLVTGLRPDDHGIVENSMRDPTIPGVPFELGAREAILDPHWWNGAEPIWVTAEENGLRTAVMFWIGGRNPRCTSAGICPF